MVEKKYWDPKAETMPRDQLQKLQLKKLSAIFRYAYNNARFYHQKFDAAGIKPNDLKTISDFQKKVPTTVKEELREYRTKTRDPFGGVLAVPREKLQCIASSSGTTGMPTIFGVTLNGWKTFIEMFKRELVGWNCKPGYIFHNCGVRWHPGWPPLDEAVREFGMINLPSDLLLLHPFMLQRNMIYMQLLKPDAIFAFASLITKMEEMAKSQGMDPKDVLKYKIMILGGEFLVDALRKRLENTYGTEVFQMGGLGGDLYNNVGECIMHDGSHWYEDLWLIENLDPESLEAMNQGERGNLVATTLWNEAIPHIRFRSEDAFEHITEKCGCGRTHMRGWQLGRVFDILNVKDKQILPADVENILRSIHETASAEYMVLRYSIGEMDRLKVKTTYDATLTKEPEKLKTKLENEISKKLNVPVEVEYTNMDEVKALQSKFKVVRILDQTKKE